MGGLLFISYCVYFVAAVLLLLLNPGGCSSSCMKLIWVTIKTRRELHCCILFVYKALLYKLPLCLSSLITFKYSTFNVRSWNILTLALISLCIWKEMVSEIMLHTKMYPKNIVLFSWNVLKWKFFITQLFYVIPQFLFDTISAVLFCLLSLLSWSLQWVRGWASGFLESYERNECDQSVCRLSWSKTSRDSCPNMEDKVQITKNEIPEE